jgi:hypothetical protein
MKVQTKTLEGRPHLVVPMVMIVEGVWNGSAGGVFYPAEVLKNSVALWNGKPIVVYHPDMFGSGFAGHPEIFNRQKVGVVFNTKFEDNKLKADAWLDKARLNTVDTRIANALAKSQPIEVSTGLGVHTDNETTNGGAMIATEIQPDHLALLPDQRGACSLADGAGLLRNVRVEAALLAPSMSF